MTTEWEAALRRGDVEALAALLDAGADVDALDGHGQTALMRAAHAGRLDVVQVLIARGADLNRSAKYHLTALMLAALGNHESVVGALLEAGADPAVRGSGAPGFAGKTAEDLARSAGYASVVGRFRR